MSDCGCSVKFQPCDTHAASLESGNERVHIEVRFHDKYSWFRGNNHRVSLERVQRIELGLDNDAMDFNEITIADMLQKLADSRPYGDEAFVLRALANALRGEDDDHHLLLKQNKPGKWESPAEFETKHNRELSWLWTLASWEKDGMKTEAAIARIAELSGFSRASVFAGVKRAENSLDRAWNFPGKERFGPRPYHLTNPRPGKTRNT